MTTVDSTDVFEPILDVAEVRRLTTTARTKEIDMTWAERIGKLTLGQAFNTQRPDTESVRQFKKRINAAAGHTFRSLDWTTLDPKQPEGVEPKRFLAKVKAIDIKAQQEASQKAQTDGSANGTETSGETTSETPETSQRSRR
jgi:hypothetical protein